MEYIYQPKQLLKLFCAIWLIGAASVFGLIPDDRIDQNTNSFVETQVNITEIDSDAISLAYDVGDAKSLSSELVWQALIPLVLNKPSSNIDEHSQFYSWLSVYKIIVRFQYFKSSLIDLS